MKCHWCKEQLYYCRQLPFSRLYSCNEGHCQVYVDKNTNKINRYIIYLYSDDTGTERYYVEGTENVGMLFRKKVYPERLYRTILELKVFIPMSIGEDGIVKAESLFDQNKINKYILFS